MSGRVALAKIYLEKEMRQEARAEFENVIKAIPDNLYAHKKLAEIYRDSGQKDLAAKSYRAVLKLNSMDEDAVQNLHELETDVPEEQPSEETLAVEVPAEELLPVEEEADEFGFAGSHEGHAAPDKEELKAFRDMIFGEKGQEEDVEIASVAEDFEEEFPDAADAAIEVVAERTVPHPMHVPPETVKQDRLEVPEEARPAISPAAGRGRGDGETIGDADRMISEGNYAGAVNIYKKILSVDPENRKVMQRLEELRAFLKMTGKDKDAMISRLEAFLTGVKKRRDGFLGST